MISSAKMDGFVEPFLAAASPVRSNCLEIRCSAMRAPFAFGMTLLALGMCQAKAQVPLSAYVDAGGHIDAHKLTCAQLAKLSQADADLINAWYDGWYNGLNHKHFVEYRNGIILSPDVTAYCKEHLDKRIIDAIAFVFHDQRAPLGGGAIPMKSENLATPSQAASHNGTIYIKLASGALTGAEGEGILTYNGSPHPIVVGGIGLAKVSSTDVEIEGVVYNLKSPEDIAGTYGAGGVGFTIVGGKRLAELRNEKGALMELHGVHTSQEINLNLAGMTISLK